MYQILLRLPRTPLVELKRYPGPYSLLRGRGRERREGAQGGGKRKEQGKGVEGMKGNWEGAMGREQIWGRMLLPTF